MSFWESVTSFFGGGSGDEQTYKATPFDQQTFLMYNVSKLAPIHLRNYGSYKKLTLIKGPVANLVSRILNADFFKKSPMLDMTPAEISELVPQIRIYKQEFKQDGTYEKEMEIPFPAYTQIEDALDPARVGYGIKSLTITTKGGNAYQSQALLDCNLSLFFQSMDKLIDRKDGISLLDLIVIPPSTNPGTNPSISSENLTTTKEISGFTVSANTFRIRLDLGWSIGNLTKSSAYRNASGEEKRLLIDAVKASTMSFYLQHLDHDLAVSENGTVTLSINYRASMEMIFRDVRAGIVLPTEERKELDKITKKIEDLLAKQTEKPDSSIQSELNNYKQIKAQLESDIEKKVYPQIMGDLIRPKSGGKSKVYQTAVSRKIIDAFTTKLASDSTPSSSSPPVQEGGTASPDSPPASVPAATDPDKVKWILQGRPDSGVELQYFEPLLGPGDTLTLEEFVTAPIPIDSAQVEYETLEIVFLGDLLELFMTRAFEDEKAISNGYRNFGPDFSKRVKMILSDFEFIDIQSGQPSRMNLAHLPISTKLLQEFIRQQIIIPGAINYTINDFVIELLTKFKDSIFLNKNYSFNKTFKQNIDFDINNIAMPHDGLGDPIIGRFGSGDTARADKINPESVRKSNLLGNVNRSNYFYYMFVSSIPVSTIGRIGDAKTDMQAGIPHLYLGRDRGFVKKTNFVKLQSPPRMKEQRIEREEIGFDPVFALVSRYSLELETVGNTIMPLNSSFFLWPTGLGARIGSPNQKNSIANLMGIGGYFKILTIKWMVDETGKFTTNISANHEGTGASNDFPSDVKSLDYYLVSGASFTPITD
jgi:hypothetical protein